MTNEQREALDRLNKDKKCSLDYEGYITIVRVADLDTVLFLTKKQEKQLDLMAEYIANNITNVCPREDYNYDLDCENRCSDNYKECWKSYFAELANNSIGRATDS